MRRGASWNTGADIRTHTHARITVYHIYIDIDRFRPGYWYLSLLQTQNYRLILGHLAYTYLVEKVYFLGLVCLILHGIYHTRGQESIRIHRAISKESRIRKNEIPAAQKRPLNRTKWVSRNHKMTARRQGVSGLLAPNLVPPYSYICTSLEVSWRIRRILHIWPWRYGEVHTGYEFEYV